MRISISYKDFEAICFAIDQIESALESSENEEWNILANEQLAHLYSINKKFKDEQAKSQDLNEARRYVRARHHCQPQKYIDKMARALIKKRNELKG